jgi:regulator of protease activity HflC (stomatin/prohibitin superfamily)
VSAFALIGLSLSLRIVTPFGQGIVVRLGGVLGVRAAGLTRLVPVLDVIRWVPMRVVTMPSESQRDHHA